MLFLTYLSWGWDTCLAEHTYSVCPLQGKETGLLEKSFEGSYIT